MSSITVSMSAPRGSRLRLTRRGRVVLASLVSVPLIAAALWFGVDSGVVAASDAGAPVAATSFQHVTVAPGQSLWQIAETVAPHADPRDVIDAFVDMNGLQSTVVTPGQTLAVPPQYSK